MASLDTQLKAEVKVEIDVAEDASLHWKAKDDSPELKRVKKSTLKHEPPDKTSAGRDRCLKQNKSMIKCRPVLGAAKAETNSDACLDNKELADKKIPVRNAENNHSKCVKKEELVDRKTPVIVKIEVTEEQWYLGSAATMADIPSSDSNMADIPTSDSFMADIPTSHWKWNIKTEPESEIEGSFHSDVKRVSLKPDPEIDSKGDCGVQYSSVKCDPEEDSTSSADAVVLKNSGIKPDSGEDIHAYVKWCSDSTLPNAEIQDGSVPVILVKEEKRDVDSSPDAAVKYSSVKVELKPDTREDFSADANVKRCSDGTSPNEENPDNSCPVILVKKKKTDVDFDAVKKFSSIKPDSKEDSSVDADQSRGSDGTSPTVKEVQDSHVPLMCVKKEKTEELWDPSSSNNSTDTFWSVDSDTKSDRAVDFVVHFENCVKREPESDDSNLTSFAMSDGPVYNWHFKQGRVDGPGQMFGQYIATTQQERGSSVRTSVSSTASDSSALRQNGLSFIRQSRQTCGFEGDGFTLVPSTIKKAHKKKQGGPITCSECNRTFTRMVNLTGHMKHAHSGKERVQHVCSQCHKTFSRADNLRVHLKQHAGEKEYVCTQCGAAFITSSQLTVHIRSHTGEKPFSCPECPAAFTTSSTLKAHRRKHSGLRPYCCVECNISFKQPSCYRVHLRRKHATHRPFSCQFCDETFVKGFELTAHIKRRHVKKEKREKIYSCNECGSAYTTNYMLKAHKRRHTGEKPYVCTKCEKAFSTRVQLRAHVSKHTGQKPYSCAECNKTFTTCSHLSVHKRIHSGYKPYACTECESAFSTRGHMKVHMRKHSGQKPYSCSQCGASYTMSCHLKKHLKKHAQHAQEMFPCPDCTLVFKRAQRLKTHMRTHMGLKIFTCSECPATFVKSCNYKVHLRKHTGERPYACLQCPLTFADAGSLKRHMRIHSGERPYSCRLCGATFRWSNNLTTHLKSHAARSELDASFGPLQSECSRS